MSKKVWQTQFSVSMIGQSVQDETLTSDVLYRHNMGADAAVVSKRKFKAALAPFKTWYSAASGEFRRYTHELFPGVRVVVEGERDKLIAKMSEHQQKYADFVSEFIDRYYEHIETERAAHNGSFRLSDYPQKWEVADKFKFSFNYFPLPAKEQFIEEHLKEEWAANMTKLNASITNNAGAQLLNLIRDVAQVLGDPEKRLIEGETKKGVMAKLREFNERIPSLNLNNDPQLTQLSATVQMELDYTGAMLRKDDDLRMAIAAKAAAAVSSFGQFNRKIAA